MIDATMCRSYTLQRGRAANTIRNELSAIRSALKWAAIKPAEPLALPAMPESDVQHLSKSQFRNSWMDAVRPTSACLRRLP
jgi:hypothetical protein